jgi:hypothetical protein
MLVVLLWLVLCCLLAQATQEECQSDVRHLLLFRYVDAATSRKMLHNSGTRTLGDYGVFDTCQGIAGAHMCYCDWNLLGISVFNGFCFPSSCDIGSMPVIDGDAFGLNVSANLDLNKLLCSCGERGRERWNFGGVVVLIVFAVMAALCAYASYMTIATQLPANQINANAPTSSWNSPLAAFDLQRNWNALFLRDPNRKYQSLDGLRALSMIWIVFAHTANFSMKPGFVNFQFVYQEYLPSFRAQLFILGGNFAVDTFFYLSGFLSTHVLLRKAAKANSRTPGALVLAVGRWLRLMPMMFTVMLIAWQFIPNIGHGPFWFLYTDEIKTNCDK